MSDGHALIVEALMLDLDATETLLTDALIDAQSYRMLAQQAIHALHELTHEQKRLREVHRRLIDQQKRLDRSLQESAP